MSDYDFTMPWPPTVNHFHQPIRVGKGARIIKGVKARKYSAECYEYLKGISMDGEKLSGRLQVSLTLHPPTLAKYDIDNRTKGVFDALSESGFWCDDEQVDTLIIYKAEKVKGGLVEVSVNILDWHVTCNYIKYMAQTTAERQRERRKRLREEGRVKAEYWPFKENKKALDDYAAKLEGEKL